MKAHLVTLEGFDPETGFRTNLQPDDFIPASIRVRHGSSPLAVATNLICRSSVYRGILTPRKSQTDVWKLEKYLPVRRIGLSDKSMLDCDPRRNEIASARESIAFLGAETAG